MIFLSLQPDKNLVIFRFDDTIGERKGNLNRLEIGTQFLFVFFI